MGAELKSILPRAWLAASRFRAQVIAPLTTWTRSERQVPADSMAARVARPDLVAVKGRMGMSALGHKRKSCHARGMSVLPLKADIRQCEWHVRYVPEADLPYKEVPMTSFWKRCSGSVKCFAYEQRRSPELLTQNSHNSSAVSAA